MSDPTVPTFAGRSGRLLLFRVNRRPLEGDNLFADSGIPGDVFDHFLRVFVPGYVVVTGRGHQRTWRAGGLEEDREARVVTGRLGWEPRREDVVPAWSENDLDWSSSRPSPQGGRLLPFGFDGDSRLLTVLRDSKTPPSTLAEVFQRILRDNEMKRLDRSTKWSVEPVLDRQDFLSWLRDLDVVTEVSFTAKLPNPEPGAFEDVIERLKLRHATSLTETLRSDRETGLHNVEEDPVFRTGLALGEKSFATVTGAGLNNGAEDTWNGRDRVASEPIQEMPARWRDVRALIASYLKGRFQRFIRDQAAT